MRRRHGSGLVLRDEASEVLHLAALDALSDPLAEHLVPVHAPMHGRPSMTGDVLLVGAMRDAAEIGSPVVEPIPADMVDLFICGRTRDLTVHPDLAGGPIPILQFGSEMNRPYGIALRVAMPAPLR